MTRDELLLRLKDVRPWLTGRGVTRLRVFGPHAKDKAAPDGDVNLLVNFDRRISLMEMIGIEQELARKLAAPVQLAQVDTLNARDRRRIEGQSIDA